MANSAQAKKRAKQAAKARLRNVAQRSAMRTAVKKVIHAVELKDKPTAQAAYTAAVSALDKAACKGLIHKNKAARLKSRLNVKVKAIA